MIVTSLRSTASMRTLTRGFASSVRCSAEAAAPSAPPTPRPRPNHQSQRPSQSNHRGSDRPRAGHRNRAANGQNGNRNAGGERRNKRLPSVFDTPPASTRARPARGAGIKSLGREVYHLPAPVPSTDWNSPLFSQPGFQRLLATAPRPSGVFTPGLTAAAPSTPATAAKGKGKVDTTATTAVNAKLNLPGIKSAVNALKLHVRPGGRNVLGPVNNPTGVAAGSLSHNRVTLAPPAEAKDTDDKSLAAELKATRIALQNEQIGGSYERFAPESVLKLAGIHSNAEGASPQIKAIQDAAQALAVNADLAPEAKGFVAQTISERLSA